VHFKEEEAVFFTVFEICIAYIHEKFVCSCRLKIGPSNHIFMSCRHFVAEVKTAHFSLIAALRNPLFHAPTLINLIGEVALP
jgi:hypothetical protein